MFHIIVDLEFTPVTDRIIRRELKNEVIEIGAVRLDGNYEFVDCFDINVQPADRNMPQSACGCAGF